MGRVGPLEPRHGVLSVNTVSPFWVKKGTFASGLRRKIERGFAGKLLRNKNANPK